MPSGLPGPDSSTPTPVEIYEHLRSEALHAAQGVLPMPTAEHPDVSGVVIDIPTDGGYVSIVALTDDTTSMYTSVGGGTIGAGTHARVAQATHRLLIAVQGQLDAFSVSADETLPTDGWVRFTVLTPVALRVCDVPEPSFWGQGLHLLSPVISASHEVIAAIRDPTGETPDPSGSGDDDTDLPSSRDDVRGVGSADDGVAGGGVRRRRRWSSWFRRR